MSFLERRFRLSEHGTTVRREVTAGLVTFTTLSYVIFVQPAVLSHPVCGMDAGGVLFATCVASAVACFCMALWSNYPFALAPAMGHNFFFVFTACAALGLTWQQALTANLLSGLFFLALSGTRARERVMHAIPRPLVASIAAGIGLLIALIGLEWGGLVVDHPATFVQLGDLASPIALLTLFGLILNSILMVRRVPGAILIGVLCTAAAGYFASRAFALDQPLVELNGIFGAPPSPKETAFAFDFAGLFALPWTDWLSVILVFLILDLFDTVGSLIGLGRQAGLLVDGKLERARGALSADAVGTVIGASLGTSTVTSYVESAAGIAAGGRTGLTSIVVGVCMLGALVLTPLVTVVGAGVEIAPGVARYPVIAPVLILIGALMISAVADVDWKDLTQGIPAFLTLVITPLTFSITDGIAWGFISWSILSVVSGKAARTPLLLHVFAAVFVLRYLFLIPG